MMNIQVNNIDFRGSIVDGPGVRNVIFLQGCLRHCPGCHNRSTWNVSAGICMDISELANIVKKNTPNKKITISGGEPLLQSEQVLALIKLLKGFDIVLYTSFQLNEVPVEILNRINYVKVGSFIEKLKTSTMRYVGSSNQQFIELNSCKNKFMAA